MARTKAEIGAVGLPIFPRFQKWPDFTEEDVARSLREWQAHPQAFLALPNTELKITYLQPERFEPDIEDTP